jgi:hypothetical protein
MESIEENGIETPLSVGKDGVLGDGHRRLACAKEIGLKTVPVIKSEKRTGAEIYADNCTQKPTRGGEWLQAVSQGFPLDLVPSSTRRQIEHMQRIHPADELKNLADGGQSPAILSFARYVGRHIGDVSDGRLRQIILWFVEHNYQYKARKAIEDGCPPLTVLSAIEENRPIRVEYK